MKTKKVVRIAVKQLGVRVEKLSGGVCRMSHDLMEDRIRYYAARKEPSRELKLWIRKLQHKLDPKDIKVTSCDRTPQKPSRRCSEREGKDAQAALKSAECLANLLREMVSDGEPLRTQIKLGDRIKGRSNRCVEIHVDGSERAKRRLLGGEWAGLRALNQICHQLGGRHGRHFRVWFKDWATLKDLVERDSSNATDRPGTYGFDDQEASNAGS